MGGTWTVGQRARAYFASSSYDIDIKYPFTNAITGTQSESTVHVKCAKQGQTIDKFKYEPNTESSTGSDSGPQSAHFILTTRLACPPQISLPVWPIIVITIVGIGAFCVCTACCAFCRKCSKSSSEEQLSELDEVALDSARVSSAFHRSSNFESREFNTSAETSTRETPIGPEVHLPQNSRSRTSQTLPQQAQWSGLQSLARTGPLPPVPELLEPPTYEAVLRLKELEASDAGAHVMAANTQTNRTQST